MAMEPIDLHHLSAIRVGDRIVYNGVGGNAFAFGDKPDLAAFALGPYPNPNVPGSPMTKSRTEPSFRSKEFKPDVASAQNTESPVEKGSNSNDQEKSIPSPEFTLSPTEKLSEVHEINVNSSPDEKAESSPEERHEKEIDEKTPSESTEADVTANGLQQQDVNEVSSVSTDKNSSSLPSTSPKKTKAGTKPTLREMAAQADGARLQHRRNSSWGAFSNLGLKIASSTSVLMAYTTLNPNNRPLPLPAPLARRLPQIPQSPPPPQHPPLPPPPPEKAADSSSAPASKRSSSSSSSKTSSASSTPTKKSPPQDIPDTQESQRERRPRPLSVPSPSAVGLPPILPRPPAAHLPPPLPSRPPAALRLSCPSSPTSSVKSSVSQRPSPDDDSDSEDNDHNDLDDSASGKGTGLVYRSSGTIRLDQRPLTPSSLTGSSPSAGTSVRRYSQSSSTSGGQPFTSSGKKPTTTTSFSTLSAAVVGAPGATLASHRISKSPSPSPTPMMSHQVSVSTPDLRSQSSNRQTKKTVTPIHSSDDEGVFEGADTSDTLSASDKEDPPPVASPIENKEKLEPEQKRKKNLSKHHSLDSAESNEIKKSNIRKFRKETEKEETVKPRRIWFFHRKNDGETTGLSDFEKPEKLAVIESGSSPNMEPSQSSNTEEKEKQKSQTTEKPSEQKRKSPPKTKIKLDNSPNCRKCRIKFGFRSARTHCHRCRLAFCTSCAPITRCDLVNEERDNQAPSLVKLCSACKDELQLENSRGVTRGLWSEFQRMRAEARDNRGLDVTSSTLHKHLESETVLDVTPGLRNLCIKFLVQLHQQLQKQPRHKFLANYLHFENPMKPQGNAKKVKNCHDCNRTLRITSDIRECGICKQVFCMACTWKTLQLFLPKGTDLRADIQLEMIRFHVKDTEVVGKGEVTAIEASEVYRVCATCEDAVARNIHIYEFDARVPELEAELFDLQRQIDHCLTFSPYMLGMQRSVSTAQLNKLDEEDFMATCVKHANRLYDRYTRAYEHLNKLMPQTGGQKALHKHIKQAMYDFYQKRRDQLKTSWRLTYSPEGAQNDSSTPFDVSSS